MSNILIVNLKRHGDILQMSHLVNSIHQKTPGAKINILVFEEFLKTANIINHVQNVYSIPRKKVISYHKNNIYSDAWGVNQLVTSLSPVTECQWDEIINYSNDKSSSYICSYLDFNQASGNCNIVGTSFNLEHQLSHQNDWQIIYNESTSLINNAPFNINDLTHLMRGTTPSATEDKLKTNANHNKTAFNNFNQIRKINQNKSNDVQIVGVQLKSSMISKDIPTEVIIESIRELHENRRTIPILLHSPAEEEKEFTKEINSHFGNKLITVESDIIALPSVLLNMDLVITPDTLTKHLADNTDTPCIEVSLGASPFLLQGSINPRSLIITESPKDRTYSSDDIIDEEHHTSLTTTIISCIRYFLDNQYELEAPNPWAIYQPATDRIGTSYLPITGKIDDQMEFNRFFSRGIASSLFGDTSFEIEQFDDKNNQDLTLWIDEQKRNLTEVSRVLLNTIRALHQMKSERNASNVFVTCLDQLFDLSKDDSLSRIPLLIFKSELESLTSIGKDQGIKEVNELLFTLKNNIQAVVSELNKFGKTRDTQIDRNVTGESNA